MAQKKVLIIDDDHDFSEAMRMLLQANGYDVDTAGNGLEGVAKAKVRVPNVIILDVMMTHQTEGYDVARTLHDNPATSTVPVIMVTGVRQELNLGYSLQPDEEWLPVKSILEKPVKPEALLKAVADAVS